MPQQQVGNSCSHGRVVPALAMALKGGPVKVPPFFHYEPVAQDISLPPVHSMPALAALGRALVPCPPRDVFRAYREIHSAYF